MVASACAVGLPADVGDPELNKKIDSNLEKIEFRCVPIPERGELVTIEVPPWPRLE